MHMTTASNQDALQSLCTALDDLLGPDTATPEERAEAEERHSEACTKARWERRKAHARGCKELPQSLEAILDNLLGPDPTTSERPAETGARKAALQSLCAALDAAIGPNHPYPTPAEIAAHQLRRELRDHPDAMQRHLTIPQRYIAWREQMKSRGLAEAERHAFFKNFGFIAQRTQGSQQ